VALPDLHQILSHAVAEGRAPDLAVLDSVWVREFAAAGFLWDVAELAGGWLDEAKADLLEPFASANTHDGRTVAIQAEGDVAGLWYRVDALEAAGCEPPRTWADLADAARAVAALGDCQPLTLPGGSRAGESREQPTRGGLVC
jgi:multiple sugar transport system substrate-binding protein